MGDGDEGYDKQREKGGGTQRQRKELRLVLLKMRHHLNKKLAEKRVGGEVEAAEN